MVFFSLNTACDYQCDQFVGRILLRIMNESECNYMNSMAQLVEISKCDRIKSDQPWIFFLQFKANYQDCTMITIYITKSALNYSKSVTTCDVHTMVHVINPGIFTVRILFELNSISSNLYLPYVCDLLYKSMFGQIIRSTCFINSITFKSI